MKRIEAPLVRAIGQAGYRTFGWGRLPLNQFGVRVGCPPHRHTVPVCMACGTVGSFQAWCPDCRRVLNGPGSNAGLTVDCRHPRMTTRCSGCHKVGRWLSACTDCRKVF